MGTSPVTRHYLVKVIIFNGLYTNITLVIYIKLLKTGFKIMDLLVKVLAFWNRYVLSPLKKMLGNVSDYSITFNAVFSSLTTQSELSNVLF